MHQKGLARILTARRSHDADTGGKKLKSEKKIKSKKVMLRKEQSRNKEEEEQFTYLLKPKRGKK